MKFLKEAKTRRHRSGDGIETSLPLLTFPEYTYYNLDYFPDDSARLDDMHRFLDDLNGYLKDYNFKFDWKDVVWMDDMMGACIHLPKRDIVIWEGASDADYEVNTRHRDNIEVNSPYELMKIIKPRSALYKNS